MIYDYRCNTCLEITTASRRIEDRKNTPECSHCGGATHQIIAAAHIAPILGGGDFPGYNCPETGEYVTSRKRRRDILRENNLQEAG